MKLSFLLLPLGVLMAACQAAPPSTVPAQSPETAASYAFGLSIGNNIAKTHVVLDWDAFERGLKEAYGGQSSLSAAEVNQTVEKFLADAKTRRAGENVLSEQAYLEANARKAGVKTTASGLQYEVLTPGRGPSPTAGDAVTISYKATLPNGTLFEDTLARNPALKVTLTKLLPGFAEGLRLMSAGARYRLIVPSQLAFGAKGWKERIEPNVPLVYEVELVSFEPSKP